MNMLPIFLLGFIIGMICMAVYNMWRRDYNPSETKYRMQQATILQLKGDINIMQRNLDTLEAENIRLTKENIKLLKEKKEK